MLKDFTKEKFDIIIQAGQSNAEGYGFGPVKEPYVPCDKVFYLNHDLTISQACEKVSGNEIQTNWSPMEWMSERSLASARATRAGWK